MSKIRRGNNLLYKGTKLSYSETVRQKKKKKKRERKKVQQVIGIMLNYRNGH